MTKRLLLDLDGVIVDLMGWLHQHGTFGHYPCRWDFTGCCTTLTADQVFAWTQAFHEAKPVSGALDAVSALDDVFDVWFLSTPWRNNPRSAEAKYRWLDKYNLDPGRLILAHDKSLIPGWVLVDDRPGITGPWTLVQYPQPWNASGLPTWSDGLADLIVDLDPGQVLP